MNANLKQALTSSLLTILFFVMSTTSVLAETYGTGEYGAGEFSVGETEADSNSTTTTTTSNTSSDTASPGCHDQAPGNKAPWLYAATAQNGTAILLYFTDADDPVSYYALEFGTESGNYTWGLTDIGGKGIRTFLVESLQPNTTYYFRVRAGNGCAPGAWSNEISVKTRSAVSFKQLETKDITLERALTTDSAFQEDTQDEEVNSDSEEAAFGGYKVNIKVKDENDQPVAGAKVVIHSDVQETTTDENGIATFENVEPGEHRVLVTYDGYEGEQSLQLTGDSEEFDLAITIKKQNVLTSPLVIAIIAGFSLVVIVLVILLVRKSKKK